MNKLLLSLLLRLLPGIDDDQPDEPPADDDTPPEDEPSDDEPPADDDTPPEDEPTPDDEPEDEPAPRETRAQKTIRETRERAQKAERDLITARAELEAARRAPQNNQPAQPTQEQVLWQQEEDTLRNPEASDWQKYAIQATRAARQAQADSRAARVRSEDMADRATFAELASTKPGMYSAYKDRVEARLAEARAQGHSPTREGVLKVLLGEDALAGKLKLGTGKSATKPAQRAPTPRQDVSASRSGGLTEAEKRAKRLENVRI